MVWLTRTFSPEAITAKSFLWITGILEGQKEGIPLEAKDRVATKETKALMAREEQEEAREDERETAESDILFLFLLTLKKGGK